MSFSRSIQWYHPHADPIWPDGTIKLRFTLGKLAGTPKRRTEERPASTMGRRKSRTESAPHRQTPGRLPISCLEKNR